MAASILYQPGDTLVPSVQAWIARPAAQKGHFEAASTGDNCVEGYRTPQAAPVSLLLYGSPAPVVSARTPGEIPFESHSDDLRRAMQAIEDAIICETPTHITYDPVALHRAYELLVRAEPDWEKNSVCGKLSVGFPIRSEDYEDAPDEE